MLQQCSIHTLIGCSIKFGAWLLKEEKSSAEYWLCLRQTICIRKMKSPSATQMYCTTAGEGLMLFMLHSPQPQSRCLQTRHPLTWRLRKSVLQPNTKAPGEPGDMHSHAYEKATLIPVCTVQHDRTNSAVYIHDNSHSYRYRQTLRYTRTHKINKSLWQMFVIRKHQKAQYFSIQIIFLCYVSRQPIWKGHVHYREKKMMHTHKGAWRQ